MTHYSLLVASPISEMKRTINICRITFILIDLVVIIFEVRNGPTTSRSHLPSLVSRETNCCTKKEKLEILEDDEDYEARERDCNEGC